MAFQCCGIKPNETFISSFLDKILDISGSEFSCVQLNKSQEAEADKVFLSA